MDVYVRNRLFYRSANIDVGLADGFLLKEYRKALADRLSPPCGKPFKAIVHHTNLRDAENDSRRLICYDCGVACDMTDMRQERIDFLRSLGAAEPRPAVVLPTMSSASARKPRPAKFVQTERRNFRVHMTKLHTAVLEGHLDFMRSIGRTVRRAGLKAYYSTGFSPRPVMVFGPALGLGIPSLAEYVDLAFAEQLESDEVLEALSSSA